MPAYLGEFEQLVLLAILRLGEDATGAAIRDLIEDASGRTVWIGAVHTTLDRLAAKDLVASGRTEAAPGRRPRKVFTLRPAGRDALGQAWSTWSRMTRGLKPRLESFR
ncbi:MAG: helix-turn-helix transcriptional regulator [Vicinamibacterales bacterium]